MSRSGSKTDVDGADLIRSSGGGEKSGGEERAGVDLDRFRRSESIAPDGGERQAESGLHSEPELLEMRH